MIFNISNDSTQPIYGALIGRKVWGLTETEARFLLRRMWYQYDIFFGPLAASASQTYQVQTYADSDFYLWKIFCSQGIAFTNRELIAGHNPAEIMVLLRDATANRNIMNQKVPVRLIAGSMLPRLNDSSTLTKYTTGNGFQFPIPVFIKRNSTIILEVTNQDASSSTGTVPFNFTLEGVRAFD